MISLGFSFKSYVGHRFRLRRQKLVARQNDLMVQLLQEALPPDMALDESPERRGKRSGAASHVTTFVIHLNGIFSFYTNERQALVC